jgi:hypothetical protein
VEGKVASSLNDIVSPIWRTERKGYTGLPAQSKFVMSLDTRPKHGYFNFGLSGVGRLPRLSRSFFHMLFFRNKLEDFKSLKIVLLKLYLMSVPLFNRSDFSTNSSFKLFWSFILGKTESNISEMPLRYSFLFDMFKRYQINLEFSSLIHLSELGSLVQIYPNEHFDSSNIIVLHDQYAKLKAYDKYRFFARFSSSKLCGRFFMSPNVLALESGSVRSTLFNSSQFFVSVTDLSRYYIWKSVDIFKRWIINLSFDFFNYIFIRSYVFHNINSNAVVYLNKLDRRLWQTNSLQETVVTKLSAISLENSVSSLSLNHLINGSAFHDLFRERLYFGSFRSTLHWYFYPVHSFFLFVITYQQRSLSMCTSI